MFQPVLGACNTQKLADIHNKYAQKGSSRSGDSCSTTCKKLDFDKVLWIYNQRQESKLILLMKMMKFFMPVAFIQIKDLMTNWV